MRDMMLEKNTDRRGPNAPRYKAEDVRGGEIILRSSRRRWIFFGGLGAAGLVALSLALA